MGCSASQAKYEVSEQYIHGSTVEIVKKAFSNNFATTKQFAELGPDDLEKMILKMTLVMCEAQKHVLKKGPLVDLWYYYLLHICSIAIETIKTNRGINILHYVKRRRM